MVSWESSPLVPWNKFILLGVWGLRFAFPRLKKKLTSKRRTHTWVLPPGHNAATSGQNHINSHHLGAPWKEAAGGILCIFSQSRPSPSAGTAGWMLPEQAACPSDKGTRKHRPEETCGEAHCCLSSDICIPFQSHILKQYQNVFNMKKDIL